MALTTYLISKSSDHITEKQIQLWLLLFRRLPRYRDYAVIYANDIHTRLSAANGTIKARMLNALMKEIDALGVGEVQLGSRTDAVSRTLGTGTSTRSESHSRSSGGGSDPVYWSQGDERDSLINEALDVLYDDISLLIAANTTTTSTTSNYGRLAAVGQRDWTNAFFTCGFCGCNTCIKGGKLTCGCR